jgi:Nickel/cobalt transporter regulator
MKSFILSALVMSTAISPFAAQAAVPIGNSAFVQSDAQFDRGNRDGGRWERGGERRERSEGRREEPRDQGSRDNQSGNRNQDQPVQWRAQGGRDRQPQPPQTRDEQRRDGRADASQDGRYYDRNRDGNVDRRWDRNRDDHLDRNWDRNRDGRLDRRYDRNDDERLDRRWDRNRNGDLDRRYDRNNDNREDRWNTGWRNDRRYDWRSHRQQYRSYYSPGRYSAPYRGYGYNRISIGFTIGSPYYSSRYWINDPYEYRLPPAYGPYRWVRYYDDVLLIDLRNGRVVDVITNFFW